MVYCKNGILMKTDFTRTIPNLHGCKAENIYVSDVLCIILFALPLNFSKKKILLQVVNNVTIMETIISLHIHIVSFLNVGTSN